MVKDNILYINEKILSACERVGRKSDDITILGVTKTFEEDTIRQALDCGITNFAENRVQELVRKQDKIPEADWHLIGHLQTNKVKYIADKVKMIHSVDSIKLANEINSKCEAKNIVMDVLIEMNISGEKSKFGIGKEEIYNILENICELKNIRVKGLMTMAPLFAEKHEIRQIFRNLFKIFIDISAKKYNNINMEYLSMGMSNDFEIAVEEGANILRIGRRMFS